VAIARHLVPEPVRAKREQKDGRSDRVAHSRPPRLGSRARTKLRKGDLRLAQVPLETSDLGGSEPSRTGHDPGCQGTLRGQTYVAGADSGGTAKRKQEASTAIPVKRNIQLWHDVLAVLSKLLLR
jgi:hypothetical protein